jgi:hypothetical protein
MKIQFVLLALMIPAISFADDLCEPRESLRTRVTYCHENFEYIPAAAACSTEYKNLVATEQARLKSILDARIKAAAGTAQNIDFKTSDQVLTEALDDLDYLIDYGKQVHTEIEDYVYAMVLPIYDEEDAGASLSDPEVKKRFMDRECFGDPTTEMEKMEFAIRPMVQDLENTKNQVATLINRTEHAEGNLQAVDGNKPAAHTYGQGTLRTNALVKGKARAHPESTITGKIKNERLPSSGKSK